MGHVEVHAEEFHKAGCGSGTSRRLLYTYLQESCNSSGLDTSLVAC